MTIEHLFQYLDELKVQLPAQKFIRDVKSALIGYLESNGNFDRFVENVRLLMHLNDMTVESLSMEAGFNRSYVGRLLRKESSHRQMSVESLRKLAGAFNAKPSHLLGTDINKGFREALKEMSR